MEEEAVWGHVTFDCLFGIFKPSCLLPLGGRNHLGHPCVQGVLSSQPCAWHGAGVQECWMFVVAPWKFIRRKIILESHVSVPLQSQCLSGCCVVAVCLTSHYIGVLLFSQLNYQPEVCA